MKEAKAEYPPSPITGYERNLPPHRVRYYYPGSGFSRVNRISGLRISEALLHSEDDLLALESLRVIGCYQWTWLSRSRSSYSCC